MINTAPGAFNTNPVKILLQRFIIMRCCTSCNPPLGLQHVDDYCLVSFTAA